MIPFLIICSADRLENYLKYKFCLLSCGSLSDAKIGVTWEGFSSCRAWEETPLMPLKPLKPLKPPQATSSPSSPKAPQATSSHLKPLKPS